MTRRTMYRASRRRAGGARLASSRRGFTLVELIVALMILTVGLLALVGTSVSVTQQISMSARRTQAANIAEVRFERFRSRNHRCSDISAGTRSWPRGITEKWHVTAVTAPPNVKVGKWGAVVVTDSVKFTVRQARPTRIVFESVIACEIPVAP